MNKTVFLDRDGVIVKQIHYLHKIEQVELIEGVKEAINILKENNYQVLVVTNQSVIGRGLTDVRGVFEIHEYINEILDNQIDDFFFCPHLPNQGCLCRKPNILMFNKAFNLYGVDIANSYMVGDKISDIQAGYNAGLTTIAVRTGYADTPEFADYKTDNLLSAVEDIICKQQ